MAKIKVNVFKAGVSAAVAVAVAVVLVEDDRLAAADLEVAEEDNFSQSYKKTRR